MQPNLPEHFVAVKSFIMGSYNVTIEADGSPLARSGEFYTAHTVFSHRRPVVHPAP